MTSIHALNQSIQGTAATASANARASQVGATVAALTQEGLRRMDFPLTNDCMYFSWSPKAAFDARDSGEIARGEFDTLYDYLTKSDYVDIAAHTLLEVEIRSLPKPTQLMAIYRVADNTSGAEHGVILPGASVTSSRQYAERHAELNCAGQHRLMTTMVYPDELVTLGNPNEFTYVPRSLTAGFARYISDLARITTTDNAVAIGG